jgi:hypothetical protein
MDAPLLFWSSMGELACAEHAPSPESSAWIAHGWCSMTESDVEQFTYQHGGPPACALCIAIERRRSGGGPEDIWHAVRTDVGWTIQGRNRVVAIVRDAPHMRG